MWRDGHLVAVIDWEDACVGDPLADLATARVELLCQYGTDAMDRFTERYRAAFDELPGRRLQSRGAPAVGAVRVGGRARHDGVVGPRACGGSTPPAPHRALLRAGCRPARLTAMAESHRNPCRRRAADMRARRNRVGADGRGTTATRRHVPRPWVGLVGALGLLAVLWVAHHEKVAPATEVMSQTAPTLIVLGRFVPGLRFVIGASIARDRRDGRVIVTLRPGSSDGHGGAVHLELVSLIVDDYDAAIEFFVDALRFEMVEDSPSTTNDGRPKRWVVVRPPGARTGLLLAQADGDVQRAVVGRQHAGRVGFFLRVDDCEVEYERLRSIGVRFVSAPRDEPYGRVAMFEDVAGNRWDLLGSIA